MPDPSAWCTNQTKSIQWGWWSKWRPGMGIWLRSIHQIVQIGNLKIRWKKPRFISVAQRFTDGFSQKKFSKRSKSSQSCASLPSCEIAKFYLGTNDPLCNVPFTKIGSAAVLEVRGEFVPPKLNLFRIQNAEDRICNSDHNLRASFILQESQLARLWECISVWHLFEPQSLNTYLSFVNKQAALGSIRVCWISANQILI